MTQVRIINGFERLGDNDLIGRANYIRTQMTGNIHFPAPDPALADVLTITTAFDTALLAARTGNRQEIVMKNLKRKVLIHTLHLLGNYVLYLSRGNAEKATYSGFKITNVNTPTTAVTAPEGVQLDGGINLGELLLTFKKVPSARSYVYAVAADPITPNSQWQTLNGTITKNTFTGLESGKRYWCRVAAVGIKNQVVYSAPVTLVVQ